jgi:hypothetical protein
MGYQFSELVGAQTHSEVTDALAVLAKALPRHWVELAEIADGRRDFIDFMSRPSGEHDRSNDR